MNPVQAIMGGFNPLQTQTGNSAPMLPGGPFGAMQAVLQRANQIAKSIRNPQQIIQQYFPDAPVGIQNDPDQIVNWLQQTGRVDPQTVQMARQMMGR